MLHNFGGNHEMFGALPCVAEVGASAAAALAAARTCGLLVPSAAPGTALLLAQQSQKMKP